MNWLKKIMKKILKNKTKLLTETGNTKIDKKNNEISNKKIRQNNFLKEIEAKEIEDYTPQNMVETAIEQYLFSLQKNKNNNITSYGVLTDLGAFEDTKEPGRNPENEKSLIQYIRGDKEITLQEQKNNGQTAFFHILKGKPQESTRRIYLNCERKDVAYIAKELIKELQGTSSYYFKFNADESMKQKRRTEKFVFYISDDEKELNNICNAIESIKKKNPTLFKNTNSVNPFLNVLDNYIMYANDAPSGKYITLSGKEKEIARSYNTLLAEALDDAYLNAIRTITAKNEKLSIKTKGEYYKNSRAYTQLVLEDILENPQLKRLLILGIRDKLKICMKQNPTLQIKGLETDDGETQYKGNNR